jgi:HK97 family phage prohead protease
MRALTSCNARMAKIKVPAQLFRSAQFDRASVDTENRTVSLSVSSDEPYERYFGTEILSHKSDSVRLGRLKSAGALLFNHDRDAHIGRVLSASVDGSKLNVVVKFGKGALASEKFQDVQDGILGEASIGYEIHKMEEDADEKSFTATDWEPYECSLVTVPADFSVGVGRAMEREKEIEIPDHVDKTRIADANANNKDNNMSEPTVTPEPAKIDVVKEREQAVTEFQSRCQKIDEYVGAIKQPKWQEAAREVASKHKNGKADFDAFRTEAINAFDPAKHVEVPETKIGMSRKSGNNFQFASSSSSFTKGQVDRHLEKEACEAAREQLRKAGDTTIDTREGFTLPEDMANH